MTTFTKSLATILLFASSKFIAADPGYTETIDWIKQKLERSASGTHREDELTNVSRFTCTFDDDIFEITERRISSGEKNVLWDLGSKPDVSKHDLERLDTHAKSFKVKNVTVLSYKFDFTEISKLSVSESSDERFATLSFRSIVKTGVQVSRDDYQVRSESGARVKPFLGIRPFAFTDKFTDNNFDIRIDDLSLAKRLGKAFNHALNLIKKSEPF